MKPYINFLIFILVAIALYTASGMVMFQQDEPKPFVFTEPKWPPEFLRMDEANTNTADTQQKNLAIEEAQKAVSYYREQQQRAPQQVKDTISLLVDQTRWSPALRRKPSWKSRARLVALPVRQLL